MLGLSAYRRPLFFLALSFLREILCGLRVFQNKVGYSFSFEVGRAGVVDSGVVSVGSPESFCCFTSYHVRIKFMPIAITSTTSRPLIRSTSEKS